MDAARFREIMQSTRNQHPQWFDLEQCPPATESEIRSAEEALGVRFPSEYKEYLSEYGGGDVVFLEIYPVKPGNRSVVTMNAGRNPSQAGFLAISDDGTGNEYGFPVSTDGVAEGKIAYFDFESDEISDTQFCNLFDFVARKGLHAG